MNLDGLNVEMLFDYLVEAFHESGKTLDWIEEHLHEEVDRAVQERRDINESEESE
jgi:hypothetical protein